MTEKPLPLRFGGGRYDERPPVTRLSFDPAALARPLAELEPVTAAVAKRLATFGLGTVGDLIEHFPRRYEDFRDRKQIRDLKVGEEATVRGEVVRVSADRTARRRVDVVRVVLRDDTGAVEAVWFNQRYLTRVLREGMRLSLRGTFRPQGGRQSFVVKGHEILDDEEGEGVHTEGVVPVYPASEQVSAKLLRGLVHAVAPVMRRLPDPLPSELLVREGLPRRADAVIAVHLPRTLEEARPARARLVLEELLLMQVGLLLHKQEQQRRLRAPALAAPGELSRSFLDGLPFALTSHQLQALDELEGDLRRETPMRRLLQGDVGSGKTVVALYCLVRAAEAGLQGVLLAPTETLATQHAETAARLVGPLASAELVTASLTAKERREALARLAAGETRIAIGTHALLQDDVRYAGLALLVVDEQHRFGVAHHQVHFAQFGTNPWFAVGEIGNQLSKPRYRALEDYFDRLGPYGKQMMLQTGSLHINMDLGASRTTAIKRIVAANLLVPFVTAIFAHSPIIGGNNTGHKAYRSFLWQHLDVARTGILPIWNRAHPLDFNALLDAYLDLALSAPVIYIPTLDNRVFSKEVTMEYWMANGVEGLWPGLPDFENHVSLLFPEVRLKGYLEIRSVDAPPKGWEMVPVCFYCGVLYSDSHLDQVLELLLPLASRIPALFETATFGFDSEELFILSRQLVLLALDGFDQLPGSFKNESHQQQFISFYEQFTSQRRTFADGCLDTMNLQNSVP